MEYIDIVTSSLETLVQFTPSMPTMPSIAHYIPMMADQGIVSTPSASLVAPKITIEEVEVLLSKQRYFPKMAKTDSRRIVNAALGGSLSGALSGSALWAWGKISKANDGSELMSSMKMNAKGFARTALICDGSELLIGRYRDLIATDSRVRPSDKFKSGFLSGYFLCKGIPYSHFQRFTSGLQFGFFHLAAYLYESHRTRAPVYIPHTSIESRFVRLVSSTKKGKQIADKLALDH